MSSEGWCDPAFEWVREVFDANLAAGPNDGGDLGAAVTVEVAGRPVVDLWGGPADERTGRPWERDTACVAFSCTKAITSAAALHVAERDGVDLDAPVTDWWPEFGAHGKSAATLVDLLTHRAGLPAFDRPVSPEEAADPTAMAAQLADQTPEWEPGTDHGYHAITFGWLVGEFVRRRTGLTVGEYVRREIGADLRVGVTEAELDGLARMTAGRPGRVDGLPVDHDVLTRLMTAFGDPESLMRRSTGNPAASFNKPVVLTGGWPAAGLVCTARALAGFYSRFGAGEIVSPALVHDALRPRVQGPDRTMVLDSSFGLGFMLPSGTMPLPAAASGAFGHPGASGALGLGDLAAGLGFGFVCNVTRPSVGDRRAYRLLEAVYSCL